MPADVADFMLLLPYATFADILPPYAAAATFRVAAAMLPAIIRHAYAITPLLFQPPLILPYDVSLFSLPLSLFRRHAASCRFFCR